MGGTFNKSQLFRELSAATGRSNKAFERKFQNVSAILDVVGREWIKGLAPSSNCQNLLAQKVAQYIDGIDAIEVVERAKQEYGGFQDAQNFLLKSPPPLFDRDRTLPDFMVKLVRRFDPVLRDARNRQLGVAGEEFVYAQQKQFLLTIGRPDLANDVRWVSRDEGDGAGYDILSFDDREREKFIEVKTTVGGSRTPFFVSRNEVAFCRKNADSFSLFRLYDFRKGIRGFELRGAIDSHVKLSPENYRAAFG